MSTLLRISILSISFLSVGVLAEEEKKVEISCEYDVEKARGEGTHLKSLQEQAIVTAKSLCLKSLRILGEESEEIDREILTFANLAKQGMLSTFPEEKFTKIRPIVEQWHQQILNVFEDTDYMSKLAVNFDPGDADGDTVIPNKLRFELPPYHNLDFVLPITRDIKAACEKVDMANNCLDVVNQVDNAIDPAFFNFKKALTGANARKHNILVSQWQKYLDESRYQYPWEAIATARWHHEHFSGDKLVGPPPTQVIFFHPTFVVEHVHNLKNGNRDDISAAIEWVGINWWEEGYGFSITSVYNDRTDAKSVGTGLTLHINNRYGFGMVHRSDVGNSIFFNIDLLDWFGDKKEKYKKYKKYF